MVVFPTAFVFALLSRVRFFWGRSGSLDAEWQDVGLSARRYSLVPSKSPAEVRFARTLTWRQMLVRGMVDPAMDLELWEASVVFLVLLLGVTMWNIAFQGSSRGKEKQN